MVVAGARNEVLARALDALDWSPEMLSSEVNRALGPRHRSRWISRTLPYKWRDCGVRPREPLPEVVCVVLSEALGEPVPAQRLWPDRAGVPPSWTPADDGLRLPWDSAGTVRVFGLLRSGVVDRRRFLAVSGLSVLGPAQAWADIEPQALAAAAAGDRVTPALVDLVESHIRDLRRLDDGQGGTFALRKTAGELAFVAELLDAGSYGTAIGRRLLAALAELAQLAGFMCFDGSDDARAQRYYLTALRAAHAADDRPLGAHVLGSMAFQATWRHRPQEALGLLDSATRGARGRCTPRVRALLAGYEARAYAVAGDRRACEQALTRADRFPDAGRVDDDPPWVYWVDEAVLATGAGQCFAQLGRLAHAEQHLSRGIGLYGIACPRDRAVYLPSLANVHRDRRDLESACATGREALHLAAELNTARATDALRGFRDRLRPDAGVPVVDDFIDEAAALLPAA
jgi:hypothetical protein